MSADLPVVLHAPLAKGVTSVARVAEAWYVACLARELRAGKPLARVVLGVPLVLFRGPEGEAGALLDRCPHRNVPLSLGAVVEGSLQCPYHGWRFDRAGSCLEVPCLVGEPGGRGRRADSFPVREQDGLVWVWPVAGAEPQVEPYRIPCVDDPRYTTVRQVVEAEASLHAVAENALDVPHTAYLHRGLFRGGRAPNRIEVCVRNWGDRVEAEYIGEPRPSGLAGRILAPGASEAVQHYDRFILPCVAQVEYRMGNASHFLVTSCMTPLADFRTRLFATISFQVPLPLPGWLVSLILSPVAKWIFHQDAVVLARQTENVRRFGGEQYTSTDVDALGQHILQLLKKAERGQAEPLEEPQLKRFEMLV
ncbi:MAG: Rieske 2Fe-2S domain-containing protein [Planctomycetota bacterium]